MKLHEAAHLVETEDDQTDAERRTMDVVVCPGCGADVPHNNEECPNCGYENNDEGRLLTLAELLEKPSYPQPDALQLNDVSPAFLRRLVDEARKSSEQQCMLLADVLRDAFEVIKTIEGEEQDESDKLSGLCLRIAHALALYDGLTEQGGGRTEPDKAKHCMAG